MKSIRPRRLPRLFTFLLACTFVVLASPLAAAQTDTGRIAGVVRDPNGAVVNGAIVTAKNERTGEERTATTDAEGIYQIPALKASTYTVTVTAPNFAANNFTNVQINVGQEQKLDVALSAKGVTEDVTVTAGATEAAIDTGSARMGATVNEREVVGLPLNGRQLSQLYLQAPGTSKALPSSTPRRAFSTARLRRPSAYRLRLKTCRSFAPTRTTTRPSSGRVRAGR